jgi:hypothetical protein
MLLTKLAERAQWLQREHTLLAGRAAKAKAAGRPPLVIVPSCFGTKLDDANGESIWGRRRQFWYGPQFTDDRVAAQQSLLSEFSLLPGVAGVDVFGGYVRYLQHIGGYTLGHDMFVFTYDWRQRFVDCGVALQQFLRSIAGTSTIAVDLLGISSGGMVIRSCLSAIAKTEAFPVTIKRTVYVCAPHRGSISALEYIQRGMEFTRLGRRFRNIGRIPAIWDLLPHPDDALFVDERGDAVPMSLYDPATWRRFSLIGHDDSNLANRLHAAAEFHRSMDDTTSAPPSWAIGSNSVSTPARVVIDRGNVVFPVCECDVDSKAYPFAYQPGDGTIPSATIAAAPGLREQPWWTDVPNHQQVGRSSGVRRMTVEALIAPIKTDARALYSIRRPTGEGRKTVSG